MSCIVFTCNKTKRATTSHFKLVRAQNQRLLLLYPFHYELDFSIKKQPFGAPITDTFEGKPSHSRQPLLRNAKIFLKFIGYKLELLITKSEAFHFAF